MASKHERMQARRARQTNLLPAEVFVICEGREPAVVALTREVAADEAARRDPKTTRIYTAPLRTKV